MSSAASKLHDNLHGGGEGGKLLFVFCIKKELSENSYELLIVEVGNKTTG